MHTLCAVATHTQRARVSERGGKGANKCIENHIPYLHTKCICALRSTTINIVNIFYVHFISSLPATQSFFLLVSFSFTPLLLPLLVLVFITIQYILFNCSLFLQAFLLSLVLSILSAFTSFLALCNT